MGTLAHHKQTLRRSERPAPPSPRAPGFAPSPSLRRSRAPVPCRPAPRRGRTSAIGHSLQLAGIAQPVEDILHLVLRGDPGDLAGDRIVDLRLREVLGPLPDAFSYQASVWMPSTSLK
jgi:hypothetical protein